MPNCNCDRDRTLLPKLKHFRRIATRSDKLAENVLAMIQLASIRLWLPAFKSYGLDTLLRHIEERSGTARPTK